MVRIKHRYYLVEILSEKFPVSKFLELPDITQGQIIRSILSTVQTLHGDYGMSLVQAGISIPMYNPCTRMAVIRVRRGCHVLLGSAMPFVQRVAMFPVYFRVLHVAGSIRLCLKFLQKHHRQQINVLLKRCYFLSDRAKVKVSIRKSEATLGAKDDGPSLE